MRITAKTKKKFFSTITYVFIIEICVPYVQTWSTITKTNEKKVQEKNFHLKASDSDTNVKNVFFV